MFRDGAVFILWAVLDGAAICSQKLCEEENHTQRQKWAEIQKKKPKKKKKKLRQLHKLWKCFISGSHLLVAVSSPNTFRASSRTSIFFNSSALYSRFTHSYISTQVSNRLSTVAVITSVGRKVRK